MTNLDFHTDIDYYQFYYHYYHIVLREQTIRNSTRKNVAENVVSKRTETTDEKTKYTISGVGGV